MSVDLTTFETVNLLHVVLSSDIKSIMTHMYLYIYAPVVACSADEDIDSKFPTNVVIESTGECSWVPLGLYISSCAIDIKVRTRSAAGCLSVSTSARAPLTSRYVR